MPIDSESIFLKVFLSRVMRVEEQEEEQEQKGGILSTIFCSL